MKRRAWLAWCAAGMVISAVRPVHAQSVVMISGPLAGSVYFTRDAPGIWASEVDRHLPEIKTESAPGLTTAVTIRTPHPMDGYRHYILKHKLLDARFRLLSQKTFNPERDHPVSHHVLPAGYSGPIYAVSICNLHDIWIEGVVIDGSAGAWEPDHGAKSAR
ncbi:MAG: hypothetical protein JZU52_06055 [Lamprocystis purpurea]|jgi:superoxide reductase|uniref:desulfoferrodoxin family protein n=1 Tax=Lamprocystis purpurea TaxID=61598 RepID=UPI00036778D0|nr:desulfoferrodoxin family protein [Lamprocystis purpurea]MBV5273208.1 hypothetical protein [Lamprocystis purpurea]